VPGHSEYPNRIKEEWAGQLQVFQLASVLYLHTLALRDQASPEFAMAEPPFAAWRDKEQDPKGSATLATIP
jgi:hypothetical protein